MGQFVLWRIFWNRICRPKRQQVRQLFFTHTLTHPGSGADAQFALEAASDADWEVTIDPATPVLLAARQSQHDIVGLGADFGNGGQ